ncbi:MAG: alpha-glucan family phosphorylase [Waddliaceae bacterium]
MTIEPRIEGYDILEELALNLRWTWSHSADKVWEKLDPDLWKLTGNPWVVLQTVAREKIAENLANPEFRSLVEDLANTNREENRTKGWFKQQYPGSPLTCIAYFSMEFMLTEGLPIYSGGLGNVAGDQLKAASDLNVPVVAIGLLYQAGYFRQMINKEGAQQELYPYNDPGQLPISPLRRKDGEWLRLKVALPGYTAWIRAWEVRVGRLKLYLLDTNDPANVPSLRGITGELYGGGPEVRLRQEMVLGIGGWRLLEALGIKPEVCHLNEGHAAFAVLERAGSFMRARGVPFKTALAATRAGNLFTTHTAVKAGFDLFSSSLIERYLRTYAHDKLELSLYDLLSLGRKNPDDKEEPFNMAYLAVRGSGRINAVSQLHGQVSRKLFQPLFQRWPEDEVPVGFVTNGVHMPSWDSPQADALWTEASGKSRWLGTTELLAEDIRAIPDDVIWKMRSEARASLISFTRERLALQMAARGETSEMIELGKRLFDPNILTLGFARRFTAYKRPNLLLHNPERLLGLLTNPNHPMQLIIAGKAHPADEEGKYLILKWHRFLRRPEARQHVIFLSDYDMMLTEQLVQGVDVWINTPRRPWEACGTSGMKVLVNGGLNCSVLDGWWAEAYSPEVGWALGDGRKSEDPVVQDAADANSLYELLEEQIAPEFYDRDQAGMPLAWIQRIRESMATLTPHFSANRAVREYSERHYIPAAKAYLNRVQDKAVLAGKIVDWEHDIEKHFGSIRFGDVRVESDERFHRFAVQVFYEDIDPGKVKVELFFNGAVRYEMTPGNDNIYTVSVPASHPVSEYTPRVIPYCAEAVVPLEENKIIWQK